MKQRFLTTRNVVLALLSVLLALCLAVGIFMLPNKANAAEDTVTLDKAEDFDIEGDVLKGLSTIGEGKIGDGLYSVVLPDGLTKIGDNAFAGDDKLYSVTIPGSKLEWSEYEEDWYGGGPSYEEIGANAFSGCTSLESVIFLSGEKEQVEKIEQQLTTIGESAFANTALTSITIPHKQWETLTIGKNAFDTTTLKNIVLEGRCSDYEWLCSENLTLKTLDISNSDFGADLGENPTTVKFESGSTVYLPEAGDIYDFMLMETLYMVSNADVLVTTNDFTKGMISDLTVESIKSSIVDFKIGLSEDVTVTFIENISDAEIEEILEKIQSNDQYEVIKITFIALDAFGNTYELEENKLKGKSYKWVFNESNGWIEDENYQLPSEIQGVKVNPNKWIAAPENSYEYDPYFTVSADDIVDSNHATLRQKVYANIAVPATQEIVYSGSAYALDSESAKAMEITKITDAEGNEVDSAVDAGTYIVYVALKNDDDTYEQDRIELTIHDGKRYMWSDGVWTTGTDNKVAGTWVSNEWVTGHWVGNNITEVDGKLVGAEWQEGFTFADLSSEIWVGGEMNGDGEVVGARKGYSSYSGGTWSSNSFNARTYTLVISPKTIELEWRNNGEKIEDVNNYELDFSASNTTDLFSAFIHDNSSALTVGNGLVFTKGEEVYTESILSEGNYVVTASHNNYSFINPTFGIRVNSQAIELSENIDWSASGGTLTDGTVHIGNKDGKVVVHTLPHLGIAYTDIREVEKSIVRYTGNAITLSLANNAYYEVSLSDNVGTDSGMYTATATLTAKAGYRFTTKLENDFKDFGITVTVSEDGKTANVTKTWYIIEAENELLDSAKSIDAKEWVEYSIEGWTYGDDTVSVSIPRLAHGDEGDNWQGNVETDNHITFELRGNGTPVEFKRSQVSDYLNGSLAAGNYELIVKVENVTTEGEHTHWWNNETHNIDRMVHNFERKYYFTVAEAEIKLNVPTTDKGYGDYEWELTSTNKSVFFAEFVKLVKDNVVFKNNADNTVSYEMQFNFSRMNSNVYYNASRTELTDLIAGGRQGTYTVYFSISADNHVTLGGAQDVNRLNYFFTVTVYEYIDPADIKVSDVDYTGGKVVPNITSSVISSDTYEVIWKANDSYVNGGEHNVSLKLYDNVHYRWKDVEGATVIKTFNIKQANNDKWAQNPGIIGWEHGYFDAEKNLFTAVPKFLDDGEAVHFAIKDSKGATVEGLGDMTAVNGVIAEEFRTALNKLPAGSYTLAVTVKATPNYLGNSATVAFVVSKSTNTWAITPNVMQWRYKSYNKAINLILGEAKIQDENNPVVFKVTSDAEGETVLIDSFSLEEGVVPAAVATKLGELTVGTYYLWSSVAETASYSELMPDEPFEFSVSLAVNDWTTAPNVIGWAYGSYNKSTNLILGSVINGAVTFSVSTKDGKAVKGLESFTSVNDAIAGILKGLEAGEYTVTATVEVDSNYEVVNAGSATLTVAKAVNAWTETPSIITWVKGQYNAEENVITVSDSFNSVIDIVIHQADDEENIIYQVDGGEVIIDNLATAEIGHYILKAVVNDTANYGGLEKTFSFQIFAPEGLAWWAWLLIIVGILGVIALVFWILHEKGILQMLTGRFVIAMRTKMTVDATIAAVRANMVAENSKKTRAAAERKDRLEALRKAREEGDTRSAEEQAAALEEKARVAAEKAEKMQKRANRMQKRAEKARDKVESTAQAETTAEDATPETTDEGSTPDEN